MLGAEQPGTLGFPAMWVFCLLASSALLCVLEKIFSFLGPQPLLNSKTLLFSVHLQHDPCYEVVETLREQV